MAKRNPTSTGFSNTQNSWWNWINVSPGKNLRSGTIKSREKGVIFALSHISQVWVLWSFFPPPSELKNHWDFPAKRRECQLMHIATHDISPKIVSPDHFMIWLVAFSSPKVARQHVTQKKWLVVSSHLNNITRKPGRSPTLKRTPYALSCPFCRAEFWLLDSFFLHFLSHRVLLYILDTDTYPNLMYLMFNVLRNGLLRYILYTCPNL